MSKSSIAVGYWAVVLALAAFAVWIRFEALFSGFFADDYAQLGMLTENYPVQRSKLDLFTFSDGSTTEGDRLIRSGFYPWFSDPTLRLSMFRPLGSAMIALDYRLFQHEPLGYHIHTMVWFCFLFAAIAALYRAILPASYALLALAMVAADEAQTVVVTWIANRSAILSVTFGVIGLVVYVRTRDQRSLRSAGLIAFCYSVAFGFGEYALCMLGYVIAFEWTGGARSPAKRLQRLWPVAVPALAYLTVRTAFHFTPQSSGVYVDPLSDPLKFALSALQRVPVMAADMLFSLRGEYWTFGDDPWFARWVNLDALGPNGFARLEAWREIHVALGALACLLYAISCRVVFRCEANPHLRWLSVGAALAVVPVIGSFPSSRLLLVSSIGFFPHVAAIFFLGLRGARAMLTQRRLLLAAGTATAMVAVCLYHLVLATWLTRAWIDGIDEGSHRTLQTVLDLEADDRLPGQHIIMLAAPEGSTSMYVPLTRWMYGRSVPRSCFTLSLVPAPYALRRIADNAFTIQYFKPAYLLRTAQEQLLRGPQHPLQLHDVVDTGVFRVMIESLRQGLPDKLLFRFEWPLEHPAFRFMTVTREGIRVFQMPAVGHAVIVPKPTMPDG